MKIAITGANGYLGANLVRKCIDNGFDVVAIDLCNDNIDSRAIYKEIDIFNPSIDYYKEFDEPDVLIHLAWRNGFVHNHETHMLDLPKHYSFIKSMVESGLKYLSIMGTVHEVGYYEGKVDETTPCNPMSLYGIAKNTLRQSIELLVANSNISFHWLRAYYIIGDDLRSNSVFGKLLNVAKNGGKEFPLNSGKNQYDFIEVSKLSRQILMASIQNKINGVINVCTGIPVSLGEKIEEFITQKHLDVKINYGAFPDRAYDSPIIYGDASKIKRIMGEIK